MLDQTQTFSLAHCPIYVGMSLFCVGLWLKEVSKKIEQWLLQPFHSIYYDLSNLCKSVCGKRYRYLKGLIILVVLMKYRFWLFPANWTKKNSICILLISISNFSFALYQKLNFSEPIRIEYSSNIFKCINIYKIRV